MTSFLKSVLLCFVICLCGRGIAATMGSVSITGSEQFNNSTGMWDSGTIMVSINGYVKTVSYGQFSTPASIAAAIAAQFSSDCYGPANVKASTSGVLYIQVRSGAVLTQLSTSTYSSMSFATSSNSSTATTTAVATIGSMQLLLGQSTNVDVQVSCGSACGQVKYVIDGGEWLTANLDGNGHFSASTSSGWSPGLHNVQVKYLGNESYLSSASNPISFTIRTSATSTTPPGIYNYNISSYAANGNVSAYSDSVNGSWSSIGYDRVNRLINATQSLNGISQNMCWAYDSFGNRTASVCNPSSYVQYPANNRDPNLQYEATTGRVTSDGGHNYLYDGDGRICAVRYTVMTIPAMIGYIYDAEGRRVAKGSISQWTCDVSSNGFAETAGYVLGPNGEQISEVDGSGNWVHTNVFAAGQLIATYQPDGLHFHLSDWLGTRRVQTDYAGNQEATYQSLPFGEMVPDNQTANLGATEQHFTGKERDAESGLDYFGERYYASSMNRFMSPDPIIISPELGNPQSWNKYSYTFNNPLKMIDPDGQWPFYIHNAIIEAAFAGVLSSHQIGVLERESYLMDFGKGQQDPSNANQHGMCAPGQSAGQCGTGIGDFVNGTFAKASAASGDDRLALFADMGHTVMDLGSPEHVGSDGAGITWEGGLRQTIPHIFGESVPTASWSGIGKSIRYLIELYALLNPEDAKKQGGSESWTNRAVTSFVSNYYQTSVRDGSTTMNYGPSKHMMEDAARQCALGNPAACN